ncbi:MAG: phosphoribosylamine--glycine ligase [bacterium]|nr:phosphoribosylamine--glycine ligase [bacterium]
MKFLFISNYGDAADLAWQLKKEGNEVRMHISDEDEKEVGDGFFEKIDEWKSSVDWADIIVFDDLGHGKIADQFRGKGKLVVGGSDYTDRLEMHREFGQEEMKSVGMGVLPHWDFDDFSLAIEFLKKNPGRFVFKPSGEEVFWDVKNLLFIGQEEDAKDLIEVLEHNKKAWSRKIKYFQLQKYASGVEIAIGAFFNGTDFIYPVNINFEHKKLFPGDIGPSTGEMGTLMFWSAPNKFFHATLEKMREKLKASGYVGYIDINCIVNSKGVYPLEFTARFGYPTISIQMEGVTSSWGEFLYAIAKGEPFDLKTKNGFQVGVVIAVPPFPYDDDNLSRIYKDSSLLFKRPNLEGVHLGEVKLVEGDWKLAGGIGYVLVVTGSNSTVDGARRHCYKRVDNIILQNMFYRTDIGEKWYYESDKLQTWGVL